MSKKEKAPKMSKEEKKEYKKQKREANNTPENAELKQNIIKAVTAVVCVGIFSLSVSGAMDKYCEAVKAEAEAKAKFGGTQISQQVNGGSSNSGTVADNSGSSFEVPGDNSGTVADDNSSTPADDNSGASTDTPAADNGSTPTDNKGGAAAKNITLTSGLNSTDVNEVLKYYKLVAEHNKKKQGQYVTKMSLVSLNGGSGAVGKVVSAIEPIGKKALEKNSTAGDNIPGTLDKIQASDWQNAKAVNDGTYTTITINVKPQTDGAKGKSNEGTVGRSIGVLDGVQTALDEMDGVSADFDNAKFSLVYDHAYIKVKVKNSTGELVKGSCEWHHQVNVNMDELTAKVTILSATLKGAKAVIDYSVKY